MGRMKGAAKLKVSMRLYLSALFVYFLSFITGFSIGLYVLCGAILLLFFGLAWSFNILGKNGRTVGISIVICLVSYGVWYLLVHYVDDYYIFYPFTLFM
ncbi:hypothetical protein [Bacillus sp. OxB-1]|uniref:hypothetical protein n=1 Tax=Bacillus sp. (strain OxB-1) TaxID=98228 RepID=UPI0011865C95|nr:hypothetical protein [Bacillus sp. OxB-1]